MASMAEFTPMFCKAISLLHSTSKSSTDQLKNLLDECLALKTNKNVTIDSIKPTESKLKESQKRPAKPSSTVVKSKKSKSHSSPSSQNVSPEPVRLKTSPLQIPPLLEEPVTVKKEIDSDATDIEDESTDAGEFALEMGLACVVCKQLEFVPGNQQVECSECHNLYHQECHKPPITDRDVSDPRNVWYCAKCTKNMEKASKKNARSNNKSPILTSSASFQSAVNSGRETAFQLIKAKESLSSSSSSSSSSNMMQPFKRVEMKIPHSPGANGAGGNSNPTTPTKPVGLAGLAANLSRTTSSPSVPPNNPSKDSSSIPPFNLSVSSSSSSSTSTSTHPSANLSKADKRIAQMKKKAANKKILSSSK